VSLIFQWNVSSFHFLSPQLILQNYHSLLGYLNLKHKVWIFIRSHFFEYFLAFSNLRLQLLKSCLFLNFLHLSLTVSFKHFSFQIDITPLWINLIFVKLRETKIFWYLLINHFLKKHNGNYVKHELLYVLLLLNQL